MKAGSSDYNDESVSSVTVTVTDDDETPEALTLTVDADTGTNNVQTSLSEGGGAKTVRVTATLDGSIVFDEAKAVTVEVGHADDTAIEGTDYTMVGSLSITIDAESSSGYLDFMLTPTNDAVDEEDETISLKGTLEDVTVTDTEITLTDDDTRGVTVSAASSGVTLRETDDTSDPQDTKEDHKETYTVVLTSKPTDNVEIELSVPDGAPFTVSPLSLTFTPSGAGMWSTKQTITVTAVNDNIDNTNDMRSAEITHTVDADETDYEDESVSSVAVTVTDDDETPEALTLTVDADTGTNNVQGSLAEGGGAKTVRVTAMLDGSTTFAEDKMVTVEVGDTDDSATEGTDYAMVGAQSITIKAGTSSGHVDFMLTPTADTIDEEDETISLDGTLAGVTVTGAEITLTDDDDAPDGIRLSVDTDGDTDGSQDKVKEDAGATMVTVTATVTGGTTYSSAHTVAVSVGDGTATVTDDYVAVGDFNITIPAGVASARGMFTLTPVKDSVDEDDETVDVTGTISDAGAPTVTDTTVTIEDDDTKGVVVSAASTGLTIDEADDGTTSGIQEHEQTYTIVLTSEPVDDVVIGVGVPGGAPFSVSPPA